MNLPTDQLRWRTLWLLSGFLLLAAILVLALLPLPKMAATEVLSDKFIHFVVFAGLMIWFAPLYPKRRLWLLFVGLLTYGMLMELLQSQVPNRYAELADLAADIIGLTLGWAFSLTPLRRWPLWVERQIGNR